MKISSIIDAFQILETLCFVEQLFTNLGLKMHVNILKSVLFFI